MISKKCVLVFVLVLFFSLESMLFAQKPFEGVWEQTSITESQTPMGKKIETEKQKVYYKPGKLMILNTETGDLVIFRADKQLIWQVNKKEGTYTEITFAQMEEAGKQVKEAMATMRERMKTLSPEQQEMMQKMMGEQMATITGSGEAKIAVKKTGETKNINGHKCEHVLVYADDIPTVDMWVANELNLGKEVFEFYRKMGIFKSRLMEAIMGIKGFVMQSKVTMGSPMSRVSITTTVTKITPRSVCSCTFELPSGLKKKEMPMMPSK